MNQNLLLNLLLQLLALRMVPTPANVVPGVCPPGDPLAGVVRPQRLQVINPCQTVTGEVSQEFRAPDGDIHLNVILDPAFGGLINQFNTIFQGGTLVAEIVPADQGRVTIPPIGARIALTGTLVIDTPNGWVEIHPVRQIQLLR